MRLAPLILLAALAVGCAGGTRQATRTDPVTVETATTTTLSEYERDFDNCKLLNDTILAVSDDYYAGEVDGHTGLSSIRLALETMEALDCGRFSPAAAREMAEMDRTLRSVGY